MKRIACLAITCLANACLANQNPVKSHFGDLSCLRKKEVDWKLWWLGMWTWDGIPASGNDRVALPGWSGGAPRTAELGPGREGNSRQFSNLDVC